MMNSLNLSEIERYLLNNNGAPKNEHLSFIVNDIKGKKMITFAYKMGLNIKKNIFIVLFRNIYARKREQSFIDEGQIFQYDSKCV
jgi:hypothetical protein